MARITGTADFDWLDGTPQDDVILAYAGADSILASLGDDRINGGSNDEYGEDTMSFDLFDFRAKGIFVNATPQDMTDSWNGQMTTVAAGTIDKAVGVDTIQGIESFWATDGNDVIYLGGGDPNISAADGAGDDKIVAYQGPGDTGVFFFAGKGNDDYTGTPDGVDTISFKSAGGRKGVTVAFDGDGSGTIADPWGGTDVFRQVENVSGTDEADMMTGAAGSQTFMGFGGDDVLSGGRGRDFLVGVDGDDTLRGDSGGDFLVGGAGRDILAGGKGADSLSGDTDNDRLFGEDGNDSLRGGSGNDRLFGGEGKDDLRGGDGKDRLSGGSGKDGLYGDGGKDILDGNRGRDVLAGQGGDDTLTGGAGPDVFVFSVGDGRDVITDFSANDDEDFLVLYDFTEISTFRKFKAMHMSEQVDGVLIDSMLEGGGSVLLAGQTIDDLSKQDFQLSTYGITDPEFPDI